MANAPDGEATAEVVAVADEAHQAFVEKMSDDFNMPASLAVLQDYTRKVNSLLNGDTLLNQGSLSALEKVYNELGGDVLGIIPDQVAQSSNVDREAGLITLLLKMRQQARANKDWAASDRIRDELKSLGVAVEDRPDGAVWKIVE